MMPNVENQRSYSSACRSDTKKDTSFGIVVIDYGMGNLRSVAKALESLGASVVLSSHSKDIEKAEKLVLPGVGAFGDAVKELKKRNLFNCLKERIKDKEVNFLGICLGLQLLFEKSDESKGIKGLGILKGTSRPFPNSVKVPHIGWNNIKVKGKRLKVKGNICPLLRGIPDDSFFYFCHSYFVVPQDKTIIAATTNYGRDFASVIWKDNIFGVQFHPEKSQAIGLKILENFLRF